MNVRCLYCGKKLRAYRWQHHPGKAGKRGDYGDDRFCGKSCGWAWANVYLDRNPEYAKRLQAAMENVVKGEE